MNCSHPQLFLQLVIVNHPYFIEMPSQRLITLDQKEKREENRCDNGHLFTYAFRFWLLVRLQAYGACQLMVSGLCNLKICATFTSKGVVYHETRKLSPLLEIIEQKQNYKLGRFL